MDLSTNFIIAEGFAWELCYQGYFPIGTPKENWSWVQTKRDSGGEKYDEG